MLDIQTLDDRAFPGVPANKPGPPSGAPRESAPSIAGCRVLLVVDLSSATFAALACAGDLALEGAAVELFYLWSGTAGLGTLDRVVEELGILGAEPGCVDVLDRVGDLHRRGTLSVAGCATREALGGASLPVLAQRAGYAMLMVGMRRPPQASHRFRLHAFG